MTLRLATVLGGHLAPVPAMLHHYQRLGVGAIHAAVHGESRDDPRIAEAESMLAAVGAKPAHIAIGPWHERLNRQLYRRLMARHASDWFIVADLDELQVWHTSPQDAVKYCNDNDFDYVSGCFVDRVSEDGSFPAFMGSPWQQFPLGGAFSLVGLGATPTKVTLARGTVDLDYGQHSALSGRPCPADEIYTEVHHFKWFAGVGDRLRRRAALYESGEWQSVYDCTGAEARAFVSHIETNSGAIGVAHPDFLFRRCDSGGHPRWSDIRRLVREWALGRNEWSIAVPGPQPD